MHFLHHCQKFSSLRDFHFRKIANKITNVLMLCPEERLTVPLVEGHQRLPVTAGGTQDSRFKMFYLSHTHTGCAVK